MKTVAVVGASGFLGSTLVELLLEEESFCVRPLIHSSGNAGRLARRPIELVVTDLLSPSELRRSIQGCEAVVNCSRGSSDVMIGGLRNLLHVCRQSGVTRFVHISSTAVFGETFNRPVVDESHPVNAAKGTYGAKKAQQDELVLKAARKGLPAVILCPPNITGPYSTYLLDIVQSVQKGEFALVEGGRLNCSMVDVRNLAHAVRCALTATVGDGRRLIIADAHPEDWRQFVDPLLPLAGADEMPSISREDAERLVASQAPPRKSLARAARRLVSSDVREALTQDPIWRSLQSAAVSVARRLPSSLQHWLKSENGARRRSPQARARSWNTRFLSQQLRHVRFSALRASDILGYEPLASFSASQMAFAAWYRNQFGLDSDYADLLQLCRAC